MSPQLDNWPLIFASDCVRRHLSALLEQLYWDLSQGIEYKLVI